MEFTFPFTKAYLLTHSDKTSLYIVLSHDVGTGREHRDTIKNKNVIYCHPFIFEEKLHELCHFKGYVIRGDLFAGCDYGSQPEDYYPGYYNIPSRRYPLKYEISKGDRSIAHLYNLFSFHLCEYFDKRIILIGDAHAGHFASAPKLKNVMLIDHFCRKMVDLYDNITLISEGITKTGHDVSEGRRSNILSLTNTASIFQNLDPLFALSKNIFFPMIDHRSQEDSFKNRVPAGIKGESEEEQKKFFIKRSYDIIRKSQNSARCDKKINDCVINSLRGYNAIKDEFSFAKIISLIFDLFILLAIGYSNNKNIIIHAGNNHISGVIQLLEQRLGGKIKLSKEGKISGTFLRKSNYFSREGKFEPVISMTENESELITSFFV